MSAKEKFEQEQLEKESKPQEEEDHQEDVSFEDRFVYGKMILFSLVFFGLSYQVHKRLIVRQQNIAERRAGTAELYQDEAKMTDSEREFAEPGGDWLL